MSDPTNRPESTQEDAGDVTKLSIVVRARVDEDTAPRVWLLYEHEGTREAIATSADDPYELIRESDLPALTDDDAVRVKELGADERARFEEELQRISDVSAAGLEIWTPLRTSEAFAAGIWETAVGERLPHSVFGRSTPQTLARSIRAANAHELGLSLDDQESVELRLSPRERDDPNQSHRHGQSL